MTGNKHLFWAFSFFVACFLVSSFYLASHRSLCETLEAESALIAKAFYEGKATLINQLNGKEDLDKPPGFYWLICSLYNISPSWEVAARLPSLGSVALFLFLFWKISEHFNLNKHLMFFWGFIFMFCPKTFWMSQVARMDMFFGFLCFLSLCFFLKAISGIEKDEQQGAQQLNKGPILALFLSSGLAVMVKGPLGAILIFGTIVIYLLLDKRPYLIKKIFFTPHVIVFFIVCLPWYIYVVFETDFRFFHRFILEENLSRFTSLLPGGSFKEFNHSPPTRYLVYLLTGFFPWSMLIPFWCYKFIKSWHDLRLETRLFFIYFGFVFLFFTIATSKRSDYILPLYPAASFLCASFLTSVGRDKLLRYSIGFIVWFLFTVSLCLALVGGYVHFEGYVPLLSVLKQKNNVIITFILYNISGQYPLFVLLSLVFFVGLMMYKKIKDQQFIAFFVASAGLLFLVIGISFLPAIYRGKDVRPFCQRVNKIVCSRALYYAGFWDEECTFYLDRVVEKLDLNEVARVMEDSSQKIFFIVDKKRLKWMKKKGIRFFIIVREANLVLRPLFLVSGRREPG